MGGGAPPAGTAPSQGGTGAIGQTGQSLGQTTQGVTDGVGRAVDGVDPRLGDTVRSLGKTTGDLVDGLTGGL